MSDTRDIERQWSLVGKSRMNGGNRPSIEVRTTPPDFAAGALLDEVLVMSGKPLLELERRPLTHDADRVDGVHAIRRLVPRWCLGTATSD
jgi:hypothetical protein